jgi:ribosomal protein L19E
MAAKKKSAKSKTRKQRKALKAVRKHRRLAQTRLAELLEKHKGGTLTQVELKIGLKELDKHLEKIANHEYDF